jgi:predicted Zn-dependent protease
MAAVMAHEVSHVVARHSIKRIQAAMGASILYELVMGEKNSQAVDIAVNLGLGMVFAGYSRSAENEADSYGVTYMTRAGYNPAAAVSMFKKLAASSSGESNFFEQLFADHPETQERIANVEAQIKGMNTQNSSLVYNADRYRQMKARLTK